MKKIIPPVLVLLSALTMIGLDQLLPLGRLVSRPFQLTGLVFLLIGVGMAYWVRSQLAKALTEIHTFKKPSRLVIDGLFKFSRNPIYLGFVIFLIGIWLLLGSISPGFIVVAFFAITNYWYITFEEEIMRKTFGQAYVQYHSRVRRWI